MIVDKHYELLVDPQVVCIGIPATDHRGEDIEDIVYDAVVAAIESIPRARRRDLDLIEDATRKASRAAIRKIWGKKPVTTVMVDRV